MLVSSAMQLHPFQDYEDSNNFRPKLRWPPPPPQQKETKCDCWFNNIFTDTSRYIQEYWFHFLIGMLITMKSSTRVTSWRSNTDSACFLSSTIPSASPSPGQGNWFVPLTEVSQNQPLCFPQAQLYSLSLCALRRAVLSCSFACPSGCHPGSLRGSNRSASAQLYSSNRPWNSHPKWFFFQQ